MNQRRLKMEIMENIRCIIRSQYYLVQKMLSIKMLVFSFNKTCVAFKKNIPLYITI